MFSVPYQREMSTAYRGSLVDYTAMQSQNAAAAYFTNKQLLLLPFQCSKNNLSITFSSGLLAMTDPDALEYTRIPLKWLVHIVGECHAQSR